jgi:hypothetical protein
MILNTHQIKLKWLETMQIHSEHCAMPFVWQFLEGILIHEGNIA